MKSLLCLVASTVIVGCTTVEPKYIEPTNENVAHITFKNNSLKSLKVAYYEISEKCQKRRHANVILPNTEATHKISAGSNFTFQFYLTNFDTSKHETSCLLNLRFQPKVNAHYEVDTVENLYSCKWLATDTTDPKNPIPVKFEAIEWKAGWGEDGSFCNK